MKNSQLLAGALIGGGFLWYFLRQQSNSNKFSNPPSPPQTPPNSNDQKWQTWVATIIAIYGTAKELWEPGGPFYKYKDNPAVNDLFPEDTSNLS